MPELTKEQLIKFIKANFYIDSNGDLQFYFVEDTPAMDATPEFIQALKDAGLRN